MVHCHPAGTFLPQHHCGNYCYPTTLVLFFYELQTSLMPKVWFHIFSFIYETLLCIYGTSAVTHLQWVHYSHKLYIWRDYLYRFYTLCIGCFCIFFFLPPTVNVIHVHCGLTGTPATVKMNIFVPSFICFISAEQTSQWSAAEMEP